MRTTGNGLGRQFAIGLLLTAALSAGPAALAQDPGDLDDFEPAVDTSAVEDAAADVGQPAAETSAALPADAEPAATLASDVTRRSTASGVMDEIELGRTEITGNQELPKVLYIVPWQKADPGDLTGRPVNTLLDEVLAPLNRDEFVRQVDYYQDLYAKPEE